MDAALVLAAVVQAGAAIAILTARLAKFTRDYVAEMRRLNELQAEVNRITAASLAMAQGEAMPRLVAQQHGRRANDTRVEAPLDVFNLGGGPAEGVVVETSWGGGAHPKSDPGRRPGAVRRRRRPARLGRQWGRRPGDPRVSVPRCGWDRAPRRCGRPVIGTGGATRWSSLRSISISTSLSTSPRGP